MSASQPTSARPRVLILGAGFGGLSAAKALAKAPVDVTVVDQHNYHLFQPLLYQVATAGLSPADIAAPIRSVLARQANTTVVLAEVSGVDLERRQVLAEGRRVDYDFLIVATGARHAYFGHDDWARFAPGLKRIDDATYLRRRILLAFEQAELESDAERRRRLLNFVVVGGGPTGVEMAGAIAELARKALKSDFRTIDPGSARIVLVEAAPRLLTPFDPGLSEAARRSLERLGVEIRLGAAVTACDAEGVAIGAEQIPAATIVWGAGVMASPAGAWLGAKTDAAGRVEVQADLSLPGHPEVFVIGDTALARSRDGRPLPGIAPVSICTIILVHSQQYVRGFDVFAGVFKSLFFGGAIALISCYHGFHCDPVTAEGVGLRGDDRLRLLVRGHPDARRLSGHRIGKTSTCSSGRKV